MSWLNLTLVIGTMIVIGIVATLISKDTIPIVITIVAVTIVYVLRRR